MYTGPDVSGHRACCFGVVSFMRRISEISAYTGRIVQVILARSLTLRVTIHERAAALEDVGSAGPKYGCSLVGQLGA